MAIVCNYFLKQEVTPNNIKMSDFPTYNFQQQYLLLSQKTHWWMANKPPKTPLKKFVLMNKQE